MRARTNGILKRFVCMALALLLVSGQGFTVQTASAEQNTVPESGIPVLYVNIDEDAEGFGTLEEMNNSPDHSVSCTGSVSLDLPEGYVSAYGTEVLTDLNDLALEYIRGRGNSSWQADKKPYKLKLDKNADLLGMGKNKHWVLLANRFDQSLLRNRLVSYIGTEMGMDYTPKMLPVELVINGEYYGSYLLAEQVRIGKTRVDIDELGPDDNQEPELTGGYLLSLMGDYDQVTEDNCFTTEHGLRFLFNEPEFDFSEGAGESGTQAQRDYITGYLQAVENAVLGENSCDENGVSYQEYMDLRSTVDYWWIQIFSGSYDAYRTSSTYLYKGRSDKLCWGPLWDFDRALGNGSAEGVGFNIGAPVLWLDELREKDPDYQAMLLERWPVLDGILDEIIRDGGVIDQMAAEIAVSWEADKDRWGEYITSMKPLTTLDNEVRDLKSWFQSRRNYVNGSLDQLFKVYYTVRFVADGTELSSHKLRIGDGLYELPEAPAKEGYQFLGWADENGELVESVYGQEDTTLTAKYRVIPEFRFEDVPADSYYNKAVHWALENYIATGTTATTFSPEEGCTRAQAVTLLWRAAGSPEPSSEEIPFTDVKPDRYYTKAVLWAAEMGISSGTDEALFSPKKLCTRAEFVTFLWRANYAPYPEQDACPFTDVKPGSYYAAAVQWAAEQGLIAGATPTTFCPKQTCSRAAAVTILYRASKLS